MKKAYIPVSMIIFLAFLFLLLFLFPPMREVELPSSAPQYSTQQSVSSSGQELKAEKEIALRDWNDDPSHLEMFSPKRKRLYVVE